MADLAEQPRTVHSVEWRYDEDGMNVVAGLLRLPGMFVMVEPEEAGNPLRYGYGRTRGIWRVELMAGDFDPTPGERRFRARSVRGFITAEALFDPGAAMLDRVLEDIIRRYQRERAL